MKFSAVFAPKTSRKESGATDGAPAQIVQIQSSKTVWGPLKRVGGEWTVGVGPGDPLRFSLETGLGLGVARLWCLVESRETPEEAVTRARLALGYGTEAAAVAVKHKTRKVARAPDGQAALFGRRAK